jgi:hypothetical protein
MFLPAFDTVTVIGYSSTRFGTTFAPAWTLWMADLAALNSCCPPSQFYACGGNGGEGEETARENERRRAPGGCRGASDLRR